MLKRAGNNIPRKKRHLKIRKSIMGTLEKPRLSVYRSLKNIYAQIIDDKSGKTLVFANTITKDLKESYGGNIKSAKIIGNIIGKRAL